ncbi:hypothetical protein AK812_SmicGene2968 [Symbiodinium microadriaticum]|uniref:RNase H type-1 domain-containing protein n=1 Tax=Symbiodinium microadriaticum TaxID=2951 RepID=A0A1Q9F093_SYMMI|nr:hypothetical protein AK812_SmicGene2968 [Symbiodinium microadriaticum]CAE7939361.1 unnamed protein product [Symbiodinium sp. KB8]
MDEGDFTCSLWAAVLAANLEMEVKLGDRSLDNFMTFAEAPRVDGPAVFPALQPPGYLPAYPNPKSGPLPSAPPFVYILPEDLNGDIARNLCVSQHSWFTGFRATGGVTSRSQQNRYALFSVESHAEVRDLGLGWSLADVVADIRQAVPRLRNIRVLLSRLPGLPALQICATSSEVPLPGHAYPVDLRSTGGRICTIVLFPGMTASETQARLHDACPASRRPARDFQLQLPEGLPFRAVPYQVLGPDFLRGVAIDTTEVADLAASDLLEEVSPGQDEVSLIQDELTGFFSLGSAQPDGTFPRLGSSGPAPGSRGYRSPGSRGYRSPPSLLSDLRDTISAQIPLRPAWMAGQQFYPPLDYACVSTPPPAQASRRYYTLFEPRLDHRQRSAPRDWRLIDFVTDAVREVQERVRLVYLVTRPMPGFAAPQLVLTLARAPAGCRSVPLDLRGIGGLVHTVEILFPSPATSVWEVLHDKGLDANREWEAAHEAGHLYLLDQDGREIAAWEDTADGPEWAEFAARPGPWRHRRISYGSTTAATAVASTTPTTTAVAVEQQPADRPPSLLGACLLRPTCSQGQDSDALPFRVYPEQFSSAQVRGLPASQLCFYSGVGPGEQGCDFAVFCCGGPVGIHQAQEDWTVEQYLQEAAAHSHAAARMVRFLSLPVPGLPTPQLTVTAANAGGNQVSLPLDVRELGGGVVTVNVDPGAPCSDLFAALLQIAPELTSILQGLLAADGVFIQDELGQVWEQSPPDLTASQWIAVRRDLRVPLPFGTSGATTSTTTAVATGQPTEPSVVFALAGGGTLLRLAPQRLSQLNLAASLTDLLMLLAIHGRLPREPVVTVAAAMPRAAATQHTLLVGFVVVDLPDVDRDVVILQDQSLDGSLLVALTLDRDTQADGLLAPAQVRRGLTAALNGSPLQGCRRTLITGDLIQLYQGPLAARVWTAAYLYQVLPELRLFAQPVRLPGLRNFVRGDMSYTSSYAVSHLLWVFDPGTTFALTAAVSGTVPIAVSIPARAHLLTVLYPAPDETPTMLQLSVDADCRLDSLQLPIRRGMELVFPRLTHAAVVRERPCTGAPAASRGRDDMSLLQIRALIHRAAPIQLTPPRADAPPVPPATGCQVLPTPLGRRRLNITPGQAKGDRQPPGDGDTCPPSGPRATVCLADELPPPGPGIGFGIVPGMLDFLLQDHGLRKLTQDLPKLPDLLNPAAAGWAALPQWNGSDPLQALHLFTDGSFFPHSQQAGWSVVVLGPCFGRIFRVGFMCGTCPGNSAFDGELCALVHARAIALANKSLPVAVASDCTSALQVAFGSADFGYQDASARALAGLALASTAHLQCVMPRHIRSHAGCAFNDIADALAKGAARGVVSVNVMATTETFWAGVRERVCDWVWLLAPRFRSTPQFPSLSDTGTWTKATCEAPPSTSTDAAVLQPSPDTTKGQGEICCQVLQYNCLSLRGAPAQAMMSAGLRRCSAQLAFFQETRLGQTGVTANDDYWILNAPCTPAGVGGCQIWLHRRATVVSNSTQRWGWDRSSFTILHASPQLLVATIAAGPFHFGLVSGHAPIADAAEAVRHAWWSQLAAQVRRVPRGCILLVGVDANARFKHEAPFPPQALSSTPVCCNAAALLEFAAEFDLASQAPISSTGKLLRTWTSPTGKEALIDYFLCPSEWQPALTTLDTPDLQDQHQGFDHWPLLGKIQACAAGDFPAVARSFCRRALCTEAGQRVAAAAIADLPSVGWDVDVSTHVQCFHQHLHARLVQGLPRLPTPARHPAVSEATLDLVRRHRHCRQILRAAAKCSRRARLHALLSAWRSGAASAQQCRACAKADNRLTEVSADTVRTSKQVRVAMLQDKADFSRRQIASARGAGPAKFAHLLRAITRQGRRFKPPKILPVLAQDGKEHVGVSAVTRVLGASYAAAERAVPASPALFLESCCKTRPLPEMLDIARAPSLVDLVRGFLGLQGGRAPGRSGLPAEVFSANPVTAALAYGPIVLKLLARGVNPIQWSGGTAHSIPKGSKDPGTVQGWRAILLLEADAKAFQKAWRPSALRALESVRAAGQHGGIPCHTLDQPSALVRAHLQGLAASSCSGGALFVDCASAYYAIVRDFYFAGPYHTWSLTELTQRAEMFFTDTADRQAFLAEMQAGEWLQALQLPPELHRIILAQLQDTWYIDGSPGTNALCHKYRHCARVAGCSRGAEAPTWADDVVVLFTASGPQEVEPILVSLGTQVVARLRSLGLAANLGAGKTEAIVSIKGHGSRSVRRHLLAKDDPCVTLPSQQATPVSLRVVPSYVHLGTSINAELSETPNLKRRAQLLYAAFKPVKNKLLCNPFLLFHEKREVIMSRIIPCFLHGSGLWRLVTRHEVDAALGPLNSVFRQCIRPLTGHCAKLLTQEEVLATLDLPSVEEQIRVNQVRALAYVLQDDMRASWQGFLSDGHWLRQACEAAKLVFPSAALQTLLPDGAPATLSALAGHFSGQGRALRKVHAAEQHERERRSPEDRVCNALRGSPRGQRSFRMVMLMLAGRKVWVLEELRNVLAVAPIVQDYGFKLTHRFQWEIAALDPGAELSLASEALEAALRATPRPLRAKASTLLIEHRGHLLPVLQSLGLIGFYQLVMLTKLVPMHREEKQKLLQQAPGFLFIVNPKATLQAMRLL